MRLRTSQQKALVQKRAGFHNGLMSSSNTSPATATCTIQEGLAWRAAREYGCDMSIIEDNLGKTPAERIRAHAAALNTLLMLKAGKKMTGKEGTERTHG